MSRNGLKGTGFMSRFSLQLNSEPIRGNPDHFYPKIIVDKAKRWSLISALLISIFVMSAVLFGNQMANYHWTTALGPVLLVGILLCLAPPSEGWEYKPWQATAEQVERHFEE